MTHLTHLTMLQGVQIRIFYLEVQRARHGAAAKYFSCWLQHCDSNGQEGLVLMISGNCCLQISDHGNLYEATRVSTTEQGLVQVWSRGPAGIWLVSTCGGGGGESLLVYNMRLGLFSCKISCGSQSDYSRTGTHCGSAGRLVGTSVPPSTTQNTEDKPSHWSSIWTESSGKNEENYFRPYTNSKY